MAKYNKKIVKRITDLIEADSYTIPEICGFVDISETTFHEWKANKVEFAEAIEKARDKFNKKILSDAERSLVKLIKGYDYEEKKTITINDGSNKPKIKEQTITKKHVAPNLGAIIHFQTNRDPENWKNRQTNELTGKDGKDLIPDIKVEIIDRREDIENSNDKNI